MRCIRCHRPLKRPTETGMGRVCARSAAPLLVHERDLFGYSPALAAAAAVERVRVHVEVLAVDASMAIRREAAAARRRLGVWA